jgi:hypothetical protein
VNERDIQGSVLALAQAVATRDEKLAVQVAVALGTQVLVDLNRIANALEVIAIGSHSK